MLKKIAHNSTIPALGGNHDLKPLQNLIAAEKAVLISLQKLSVDYSKASEALRTWGLTEGDYLGGILSASTSILNHFSSALSQYAAHGHSMRDQLKAIRTREESLDDLERRRRAILRKAEDADKKLSKMAPDNKSFTMQTDTLNRLRDDIQALNSDIMSEEAALDKFKRSATKVWMGLKFGGLVECCQKGKIAGDFGRLAIAEISEEMVQPGLPRSFVYPHNKIEDFVAEAHRGVNLVTLSTFPSTEPRDRDQYDPTSSNATPAAFFISAPTEIGESSSNNRSSTLGELQPPPTSNNGSRRVSVEQPPPQMSTINDDSASYQANRPFGDGNSYSPQNSSFSQTSPSSQQLGVNESDVDNFGANARSTGPQYQQQLSQRTVNSSFSQTLPSSQQLGANEGAVDDVGVNYRYTGPPYQQQFPPNTSPHPQRFSEGALNPPFSQTSSPFQQLRFNEGAMNDLRANVRSTSPPYQHPQFSQGTTYNPLFSQTSPPSQQLRVNEGDSGGANVRLTGPPYQQQFSQGTTNPTFSQTLPSSRRLGANEGAVDDFGVNTHSTGPPYQQQFSQRNPNPSFSQTLSPSQQIRRNESTSDNFGPNVHPNASPYEQRFSQGSVNSSFSQTLPPSRVSEGEGGVNDNGPKIHSPHPQQFFQGIVNSLTLPLSQQPKVNEENFGANVHSTGSPHSQQFSQGNVNPSFSQTLSPYQQQQQQQLRVNEVAVDNFSSNVRPTSYPQQGTVSPSFSQTLPPPSQQQQLRVNEDDFGGSPGSPHSQQFSQGNVNPSFSQTLSPYQQQQQQLRVNEVAVDNFSSNVRPTSYPQQGTVSPLFSQTLPPPSQQQLRVNEDDFGGSTGSPHSQQFSQGTVNPLYSQTSSHQQLRGVNEVAVDNFGSNVRSTGPADSSSSTAGGRIATSFQVQTRPAGSTGGYSLQDPCTGGRPRGDSSFSAPAANDLHERFDDLTSETKPTPWVTNQFNDRLEPSIIAEGTTRRLYAQPVNAGVSRSNSPRPVTAPSGLENLWRASIQSSSSSSSEYHDALTAPVREDSKNGETLPTDPFSAPPTTTMTTMTTALSAQNTNEEDSRYVRFGGVKDVDREVEKRVSLEKEQQRVMGPRDSRRNSEANRTEINRDLPQQAKPTNLGVNAPIKSPIRRMLPTIAPLEEVGKALNAVNAAAAREINLVLGAFKDNHLNRLPSHDQHSQASTPTLGANSHYPTPPYVQAGYQTTTPTNLPTQQQQPPLDMRNVLPPRLQALNNNNKPVDSQVPPRFQNSSSSIANSLPPRFQTPQVSAPGGLNS